MAWFAFFASLFSKDWHVYLSYAITSRQLLVGRKNVVFFSDIA